ncbi:MAG TPA: hypothetical protein VF556_11215 [Pyrinomonadaceae bacterium]|jgi:hypothetical protein
MKKRFIIALSTVLVLALAVVAFAYTRTNNTTTEMSASCPMHEKKDAAASTEKEKHSCGMADCCKDGHCKMNGSCCKDKDSCPMKNKENQRADVDYSKITYTADGGENCCQPGASCCNGGSCCKGKHS